MDRLKPGPFCRWRLGARLQPVPGTPETEKPHPRVATTGRPPHGLPEAKFPLTGFQFLLFANLLTNSLLMQGHGACREEEPAMIRPTRHAPDRCEAPPVARPGAVVQRQTKIEDCVKTDGYGFFVPELGDSLTVIGREVLL